MNETEEKGFPFKDIKEAFKGNPTKNLYLTSDYIDSLLHTDINDSYCYSILSLLYAHLDYNNQRFHKDPLLRSEWRVYPRCPFRVMRRIVFYRFTGPRPPRRGHSRRRPAIVKPHFEIDIICKPHLVILSSQAE